MPTTPEALRALDAPIARQIDNDAHCIILGKVIDYSPRFYYVAFTELGVVDVQRISIDRVHIEPCPRCPPKTDPSYQCCD